MGKIGHEFRLLLIQARNLSCAPSRRKSSPFFVSSVLMRRIASIAAALFAIVALTGAGQQAPQRLYQSYTDQQRADLDRVSAYLNTIHTLRSGFLQVGPEGQAVQGVLFIQKPGQIRFEYQPPSPVLIVATGGGVYVKNSKLNTVDNYDLSDTPLGLLLNEGVDLAHNKGVLGIEERDGEIVVKARTTTNRNNSNITMVFSSLGLELRQWMVKDNQGGITTVALQGPQINTSIDPAAFAVPQKAPRQASR
jgi:outer membrane lipoprotein-sorting protein